MSPLVCAVIPTYNREPLLARAIESVLSQTYKNFEFRVVDDGSTDGTEELVRRYPQVIYVKQENRGVSGARNKAIFETAAPWVACLDSDDEWLPDKLKMQIEFVERNPQIKLVHGEENWLRDGKRVTPLAKHRKSGGRIFQRCLPICCISPSTVMFQTELVKSLGGFREDFPVCEDYDLWLKICATEEAGFIETPLINKYGGHADQLSHSLKAMDEFRVRAMWEIRNHPGLSQEDRLALFNEVIKKSGILAAGYSKHGRAEKLGWISELKIQALDQFHQLRSAHSAADFAPRSVVAVNPNGN
jgi:glycosyltransferase involved in cell wall biosynthesis